MGSLWNRSGTVERYADDIRAAGAKAYFFSGGTTTPLSVFQDAAEGSSHPHPVVADAQGRWPNVFVPYITSYDVRVTSADNVQLTFTQLIPNPNPVDVTTVIAPEEKVQTGMIHAEFVNATKSGYVRLNGRTIGNAASSATERANADTSALFTYLWGNLSDVIATVSGGRGGTAAADFAANKNIVLPTMQGVGFVGLDDMGNTTAGAFAGLTFNTGTATGAGSHIGANVFSLLEAQLPAHAHTGSTSSNGSHTHGGATGGQSADHTHSGTTAAGGDHNHGGLTGNESAHTHGFTANRGVTSSFAPGGNPVGTTTGDAGVTAPGSAHNHSISASGTHTHTITTAGTSVNHTHTISSDGAHTHTFSTSSVGSGDSVNNLPQARLVTWFIKL